MSGPDGRKIYRVVWPRGAGTVQATDVAPRLSTLEGKTIGQLWDDLFRGDEIFPILEEELTRRFPGVRFVRYDAFGSKLCVMLPAWFKVTRWSASTTPGLPEAADQ